MRQDDNNNIAHTGPEMTKTQKSAPGPSYAGSSPPATSTAAVRQHDASHPHNVNSHKPNSTSTEPNTTHTHTAHDDTLLKDLVADPADYLGTDVDAVLNAEAYTNMMDLLQQLGVDVAVAARFVNTIRQRPPVTFAERFGQGRIVEAAAHGKRRA